MPREFRSYIEAKQHYDCMVADRDRYRTLNAEYNRIENVLNNRQAVLVEDIRDELKQDMEYYRKVMNELVSTFPQEYGVQGINQLSIEIQKFGPELERLKGLDQSYWAKAQVKSNQEYNSGSGSGDAQPPAGVRNEPKNHDHIPSPKNQDATGRTLEEVKEKNPVMEKVAELAEKASQWSPWKWISERREKALGTPLKDTLEAVMEEKQTPFADNLAAMRGQPVPARNLPEQLHEPETRVTRYGTGDYDKLYAPTKETALKDTIEAVKEREEDRSK